MTDDNFELSRRKVLGSMGMMGVAGAAAGFGTSAYFSDTEQFPDNSLVAGQLDVKAAYSAHYSDGSPDEREGVSVRVWEGAPSTTGSVADLMDGETGLPANDAWLIAVDDPEKFLANTQYAEAGEANCETGTDADGLPQPIIDLEDVKPGDFGEITFDLSICDNPGFVWLTGDLIEAAENGYTEPELEDPDESGDADSDGEDDVVELLDVIQAAAWVDDGNNYQNGDETPAVVGSLRSVLDRLNTGSGLGLSGDIPAEEGGGTGRNCFSAETPHSVGFAWWVPVDHGNEIQTDSVRFDLGFYTEQCRHNDGSGIGNERTVPDAISISASPDTAGAGDSIHRVEIPVGSGLDGEALSTITVDYPTDFDLSAVDAADVLGAGVERTDTSITSLAVNGTSVSDGDTQIGFALDGSVTVSEGETVFIEYRNVVNASTADEYTVTVDVNTGEIGPGTLTITPASGANQSVTSTFDTDDDGWQITGDAQGGASVPDYEPNKGNPAPSISATDDVQGGTWYFKAPGKYQGDKSGFYGGTLEFDLQQEYSGSASQFANDDIFIEGGGIRLNYDHGDASTHPDNGSFTSYSVTLDESDDWTVNGSPATQNDIETVLADVTDLQIRGEYRSGDDKGYLDNVSLTPSP